MTRIIIESTSGQELEVEQATFNAGYFPGYWYVRDAGGSSSPGVPAYIDADMAAAVTSGTSQTSTALRAAFVAHDAQVIDLCAAPYNATPGADITSALQSAINTIAASGQSGKILITKVGTYPLNGALQTGSYTGSAGTGDRGGGGLTHTWNAQILFPAVPFDGVGAPAITIEGAVDPSLGWKFTGDAQGVQIVSTITSGKMFEAKSGYDGWGKTWTGIMPIFRNLILRMPDNPTAGAIDIQHTLRTRIERVAVLTATSWVVPTGNISTAVAVALPSYYENGDVSIRDVNVRGYPSAFRISEHAGFDNVQIVGCQVAFICGNGGHANYFGNVDIENCASIFHLEPSIQIALSVYGYIDTEQNGLWPTMNLVNDPGDTAQISGTIDLALGLEASLGLGKTAGGAQNALGQLEVRNISHGQASGWGVLHPYDTFARNSGNGAAGAVQGAPGYSWPSMHPWRAQDGDFTIPASTPATSGKSVMRMTSGYEAHGLVPAKSGRYGGVQRSIEATFNTPANGVMGFGLIGCRSFNINSCIFAGVYNGNLQLGVGSFSINGAPLSAAGVVPAGSAVKIRLEVFYLSGQPRLAKAYVNDVLQLTRPITAAEATTYLSPNTIQPYLEDGVAFSNNDNVSTVSNFVVRDLPNPLTAFSSGKVTLAAGTATVADAAITSASIVRLSRQAAGGTLGQLSVALTAGTGFTVNSSSNTDTSTVFYEVVSY